MTTSLDVLRAGVDSQVHDLVRIAAESQEQGRFFHRYVKLLRVWEQYARAEIARPDNPNNLDKTFITCWPLYLARRLAPPLLETVSRLWIERDEEYARLPHITKRAAFLANQWHLGGPFTIYFLLGRTLINEKGFRHLFIPIWSKADASWTDFYKILVCVTQRRRGLNPDAIFFADTVYFLEGDAKMAIEQYKNNLALGAVGPGNADHTSNTHNKDDTQDKCEEGSEDEESEDGGQGGNDNEFEEDEGSLETEHGQTLAASPSPPPVQDDHEAEIGRGKGRTNNSQPHLDPDMSDPHRATLNAPRKVGSYHGSGSLNDASRGYSTPLPLLTPASSSIAIDRASPTQSKGIAVASHHSTAARPSQESPSLSSLQRKEQTILLKLERDQVDIYMKSYVKRRHEHAGIVFWTSRDVLGQSGPDSLGDLRKFRNSQRVFSPEEIDYDDFDAPPPTARWVAALFARDRNWTLFLARRNQHTESWNQAQVSAYGFDPDAPPDWRQPQEQSFMFRVAQGAWNDECEEEDPDERRVVIHARPPMCPPLPSEPGMMPTKADRAGLACVLLRRFAADPQAFWQQGFKAVEACYQEPPARARRHLDTFAAQLAKAAEARTLLDTREQETLDTLEALHNAEDRLTRLENNMKTADAATESEEILAKRKRRYLADDIKAKRAKYTHASQLIDSAYASVQTLDWESDTLVSRAVD